MNIQMVDLTKLVSECSSVFHCCHLLHCESRRQIHQRRVHFLHTIFNFYFRWLHRTNSGDLHRKGYKESLCSNINVLMNEIVDGK